MSANRSVDLLALQLRKAGIAGAINPTARMICDLMDMFNEQHGNDRVMYRKEVRELTDEVKALKEQVEKLQGNANG
ncbi:hypothetical protein [Limnoglobus roseus]|uniref:Uncharacterized protein n=1 Tax=Limnoglobus roseus TaxID=2598579 RepID=A0A5C1AL94_9BACT|nr:hypothetical protein [Limnoglobus roseus]QEL18736.1 hypothetical protein PX52LOC_05772 [Limnoglobus roseus]